MHMAQGDLPPLNYLVETEGFGVTSLVAIVEFSTIDKGTSVMHTNDAPKSGAGGACTFWNDFVKYATWERLYALFLRLGG